VSGLRSSLLCLAAPILALIACRDAAHGEAASGPPPSARSASSPSPSPPSAEPSELDLIMHANPSVVHATLTLAEPRVKSAVDLEIRVTITNEGTEPYPYSTWFLGAASLRLQARDLSGKPVRPGPPPVPRAFDPAERNVIPPGGSFVVTYKGLEYFLSLPPPGQYEIRFQHTSPRADGLDSPIETPWVRFEVRP
jgi:hypothetical protein